MRIIGLTGGICTGKSTVAGIFERKFSVPVLYVSQTAASMNKPGSIALSKIALEFGNDILNEDGSLDKEYIRDNILSDDDKKSTLIKIMNSAIQDWVLSTLVELEKAGHEIVIVESRDMIQSGTHEKYEEVIVTTCTPELQVKRIADRYSSEEVERILTEQPALARIEACADHLISTNGTLEELELNVNELWKTLLKGRD